MRDEPLDISPMKPTVPYRMTVEFVIEGRAPINTGEFPDHPLIFYEYIKKTLSNHELRFKNDGYFILVSLKKKEELLTK